MFTGGPLYGRQLWDLFEVLSSERADTRGARLGGFVTRGLHARQVGRSSTRDREQLNSRFKERKQSASCEEIKKIGLWATCLGNWKKEIATDKMKQLVNSICFTEYLKFINLFKDHF